MSSKLSTLAFPKKTHITKKNQHERIEFSNGRNVTWRTSIEYGMKAYTVVLYTPIHVNREKIVESENDFSMKADIIRDEYKNM